LHIGRTGGTALNHALSPYARRLGAMFHGHDQTLPKIKLGDSVVFLVRDPVDRFVSGFNNRLRKGRPRRLLEWTRAEAHAFARFKTPNALAEALSADDAAVSAAASAAMNDILHTGRRLSFWLDSPAYLRQRAGDVLFVSATHTLDEDFPQLLRVLGLRDTVQLPTEPFDRYATTAPGLATTLSETGRANIAKWYETDAELYAAAMGLRDQINAGHPQRAAG
jgi:Rad3-related DNA helicase